MLKIRKEQMQVLSGYMLHMFKDRMVRHLRAAFKIKLEKITEEELRTLVDTGIDKAKYYNIITEDDVQTYLEYMVSYSHDFDMNSETSWAGDILSQKDIDGSLKMIRLKKTASIKREA